MQPEDLIDDRPRHHKRSGPARSKKFGIEQWSNWFKKWWHRQWYVTEKARDQAFENLAKKTTILKEHGFHTPVRKVNR